MTATWLRLRLELMATDARGLCGRGGTAAAALVAGLVAEVSVGGGDVGVAAQLADLEEFRQLQSATNGCMEQADL